MVIQYKCPDCGADMVFEAASGMLACRSCGKSASVEDYEASAEAEETPFEEFEAQTLAGTFAAGETAQYHCNNCGSVLITDKNDAASICSFCGAPVILSDRLSNDLAPSRIIPFSIDKEQAVKAFRKWRQNRFLAPKDFASAERIKSITGIYVPFWLYDVNSRGEMTADCTRVRTYEDGDYIYTETRHYEVYRKVSLNFEKVPADASEKMNDSLMERLEPYCYGDLKDFSTPYLAGYLAEKYNYTDKELLPRISRRTDGFVRDYMKASIQGYSTTSIRKEWVDVKQRKAYYALLPVWMFCYDYKDSEHIFAMNGQTGKIAGSPPISKSKTAAFFAGVSAILFLALEALLWSGGA